MSDKLNINIQKTLGTFNLEVTQVLPLSGITTIFGPSGAGKSTLLKSIAGFETPDAGGITLAGQTLFNARDKLNMPPHKRPIGYMFQEGRLFPHLTVQQNLDFAAKRAVIKISMDKVVDAFDVEALLPKSPHMLSGGERRRTALARTVLTAPDILLLDEPLTGLDRARKRDILPFIENLPEEFGIPCLYVTHDIEEVTRVADQVLLMSEGQVVAFGPTSDILSQLDTTPLSEDYDVSSLVAGQVTARDEALQMMEIEAASVTLRLPLIASAKLGDNLRLRIRARDVAIALTSPQNVSIRNIIAANVIEIIQDKNAAHAIVTLGVSDLILRARITRAAAADLGLTTGQNVYALIKSISFEGRL